MQTVARMKVDLDQYAERKDASIQAVEIRTEILNNLVDYLLFAEKAVEALAEERNAYGAKRFTDGYKEGFASATDKPGPQDKEALRSYHKITTYQKWKDHF